MDQEMIDVQVIQSPAQGETAEADYIREIMGHVNSVSTIYSLTGMMNIHRVVRNLHESHSKYSRHSNVIYGWLSKFETNFLGSVKDAIDELNADGSIERERVFKSNFYTTIMEVENFREMIDLRARIKREYAELCESGDDASDIQIRCINTLSRVIGKYNYNNIASVKEIERELKRLSGELNHISGELMDRGMRIMSRNGTFPLALKYIAITALRYMKGDGPSQMMMSTLSDLATEADKFIVRSPRITSTGDDE